MQNMTAAIAQADKEEISQLLEAVLHRYAVLYPDWEITILSLPKGAD